MTYISLNRFFSLLFIVCIATIGCSDKQTDDSALAQAALEQAYMSGELPPLSELENLVENANKSLPENDKCTDKKCYLSTFRILQGAVVAAKGTQVLTVKVDGRKNTDINIQNITKAHIDKYDAGFIFKMNGEDSEQFSLEQLKSANLVIFGKYTKRYNSSSWADDFRGFVTVVNVDESKAEQELTARNKKLARELGVEEAEIDSFIAQSKLCRNDWQACASNMMFFQFYAKVPELRYACEAAVKESAQWGEPTIPSYSFMTYVSGDSYSKSGVAVLIEPKVGFSNGFGAIVNRQVRCEIDLNQSKVLSVF